MPRAFTLIEMTVVIGIVVVLAVLILPSVATMWEQRRVSAAQNLIKGMLTTARPRAMEAGRGESGLFFMVDRQGVQRVFPIEQGTVDLEPGEDEDEDPLVAQNQFFITGDRAFALPAPMRVVPRYVVEPDTGNPAQRPWVFNEEELANEGPFPGCPACTTAPDESQRHRNFFTMVYSTDGELKIRRDVLICDTDQDDDLIGDYTGLVVGGMTSEVLEYHPQEPSLGDPQPIDEAGMLRPLYRLVTDGDGVAVNFPSVDGLLVYDDTLFRELEVASLKRAYLIRSAQPFYINRLSGAVIRGPLGENEVQP